MRDEKRNTPILEGLAKSFLGVPYSSYLTREDQQLRENVETNQLLSQLISRSSSAPSPQTVIIPNEQRFDDFDRMLDEQIAIAEDFLNAEIDVRDAVMQGNELLRDVVSEQAATGEKIAKLGDIFEGVGGATQDEIRILSGIPQPKLKYGKKVTQRRGMVRERIPTGTEFADLSELIVLHKKGLVDSDAFFSEIEAFSPRMRAVINYFTTSDLIRSAMPDIMELFDSQQRAFLAHLESLQRENPLNFKNTLETLARFGLIDPIVHLGLARRAEGRFLRIGPEGINLGMRETNDQLDNILRQGHTSLMFQSEIADGVGDIARHTRKTAHNTDELVQQGGERIRQGDVQNRLQKAILQSLNYQNFELEEQTELIRDLIMLTDESKLSLGAILQVLENIESMLPGAIHQIKELLMKIIFSIMSSSEVTQEGIHRLQVLLEQIDRRQEHRDKSRNQLSADESFKAGKALLEIGEIDKAITCFDKALDEWAVDTRAYFHRGLCRIAKDRHQEAEADLVMSLKLLPPKDKRRKSVVLHNLGRLHHSVATLFKDTQEQNYRGELDKAIAFDQQAIIENPRNINAQLSLISYLLENGSQEQAQKILLENLIAEPGLLIRIRKMANLAPLLKALEYTSSVSFSEGRERAKFTIYFAIFRDVTRLGEQAIAIKIMKKMMKEYPLELNNKKCWEMTEITAIIPNIHQMIGEAAETAAEQPAEYFYSLASIAFHVNYPRGKSYKIFIMGTEKDEDFKQQQIETIKTKLQRFFSDVFPSLRKIIKTIEPPSFPWLINQI